MRSFTAKLLLLALAALVFSHGAFGAFVEEGTVPAGNTPLGRQGGGSWVPGGGDSTPGSGGGWAPDGKDWRPDGGDSTPGSGGGGWIPGGGDTGHAGGRGGLIPGFSPLHFDSLDDALRYNPLLSTLRKALDTTELDEEFKDPDYVATIFAPTDSAFTHFLKDVRLSEKELFDDEELLSTVLKYHVVPDLKLEVDDIYDGEREETLLRDHDLVFRKESYLYFLTKVTIEPDDPEEHDATVVLPDIEAGENVVIHVVNHVLVPDVEELEDLKRSKGKR